MLKDNREECIAKANPIAPPDYTEADVQALRALVRGTASDDQQKRAIKFIINDICGTYDFAFRPGASDRETNLALGKQRAGQILVYLLQMAVTKTSTDKMSAREADTPPFVDDNRRQYDVSEDLSTDGRTGRRWWSRGGG